jgi:hypothetical protein
LEERRFPWSRLFGQLAGVLPRDVRLFRISPEGFESEKTRSRPSSRRKETAKGPRGTWLQIAGAAKSDQALVDLLDALFASPAFADPLLPGESVVDDGTIRFQLSTIYFPDAEVESPTAWSESSGAGSGAEAVVTESGQLPPGSSEAPGMTAEGTPTTSTGLSSPGQSPGVQRVVGGGAPGSTEVDPRATVPVPSDRGSDSSRPTNGGRQPRDRATPRPLTPPASSPGILR